MPQVTKSRSVAKKPSSKKGEDPKPVLYAEPSIELCIGEKALTVDRAKELLGWEELPEKSKDFQLIDSYGKKVKLGNNLTNRPIYKTVYETLCQEHLRRRWNFNGESLIIGRLGSILNGQHSLISLILASQLWEQDREGIGALWKTQPTMEKALVLGVSEEDHVVNTMDTCKPRTLSDVLYRSPYFSTLPSGERRTCSRILDYAIRHLWWRTGANLDAYAPRRTHAESLAFLASHPRLLDCVKHIHAENGKENRLGLTLSAGYAAAMMYLMATSKTPAADYHDLESPNESVLDFSMFEKASEFWVLIAGEASVMKPIVEVFTSIIQKKGPPSLHERCGILSLAWDSWIEGGKIKVEDLELSYEETKDGFFNLIEHPVVGGIDLGNPKDATERLARTRQPSLQEIEAQAKKVQSTSKPKKEKLSKPKIHIPEPSKASEEWQADDVAWIEDSDGDHYLARVADIFDTDVGKKATVMAFDPPQEWEVDLASLHLEKPAAPKAKEPMPTPKNHPPKAKSLSSKSPKAKEKTHWKVGDRPWILHEGESYQGTIVEKEGKNLRIKVLNGHQGAGNIRVATLSMLSAIQPS